MKHYYHTTIDLRDDISIDIDIVYSVTPKISGTYYDPPEGGEIELEDVVVFGIEGDGYYYSSSALLRRGWLKVVQEIAWTKVSMELFDELADELYEYAEQHNEPDGDW